MADNQTNATQEGGLRLNTERSRRFYWALCQAIEANDSLRVASQTLPNSEVAADETSPRLAIGAYGGVLHRRLHAMLSICDGSEPDEGFEGGGHD